MNLAIVEPKERPLAKERPVGSSADDAAVRGSPLVRAPSASEWGVIKLYVENSILANGGRTRRF